MAREVGITENRYAKVEAAFARFGPLMVIAARFVVLLRQMNGLVAGTAGMHWLTFALSNVVGAALWVGFWATLAYQFGHTADVLPFIGRHIGLVASALVLLVLLGLLLGYRRMRGGPWKLERFGPALWAMSCTNCRDREGLAAQTDVSAHWQFSGSVLVSGLKDRTPARIRLNGGDSSNQHG